ncbi:MAG TPA: aspartyl protease family protein [Thermoanaerobaculia bacterium]|nr:aspartyl protease family protein [Thermoanaerobaculia bacterium]
MRRSILLALFVAAGAQAQPHLRVAPAVHRVESVDEDGMAGTRDEWATSSLQRRDQLVHAHDQTTVVYDGTNGWRRDWNGFVEKLAGTDLQREANIAFLHTFAFASSPGTTEFHPKGGSAVTIAFDPATGLPLRATMPSFDGDLTVAFSDWRDVGGTSVPFTETWSSGPSKTVSHLKSIEFVSPDRIDLTPPQAGPDDAFFLRPNSTAETLPFNFDNNHIMILTTVNGVGPIWFLVDTGANYTVINTARVSEFHMTPYGALSTIGGGTSSTSGSYVEHVTYRFGDVELRDQHAAVIQLIGLEKLYGMPLGGILGFDFLSRFVVDIDYVHKTLTLHPRGFDTSRMHVTTSVPLTMQGEQPYFSGSIAVRGETIPAWFILDVGAADTITFTTPYIAAHDLLQRAGDPKQTVHKYAAPDVEAFNPINIRGLIDGVTMGSITLPHVFVNLSAAKSGAYTSPAFDGNIGETILSRFAHAVLDYGRSVMLLDALPSTTRPFEERKSFGMSVVAGSPELHHFTVTAVGTGSPAAEAGFQKGDVITAIDGTPAAELNLASVQRLFRDAGTKHDVVVRRGSEDVTLHATIDTMPISSLR